MRIPPENPSGVFFEEMVSIKNKLNNKLILSMGMSNDYKNALKFKSNMIRIGSKIFN